MELFSSDDVFTENDNKNLQRNFMEMNCVK